MSSFADLVQSRRNWIDNVLRPWCRQATRADLLRAEAEWSDIAGRAAPEFTLWQWAWERFEVLCVEGLTGVDETYPVRVVLREGTVVTGYPDARRSQRGELYLLQSDGGTAGPLPIDTIAEIERLSTWP